MSWKRTVCVAALVFLFVFCSGAGSGLGAAGFLLSPEILGNIVYSSEWTRSGKAQLVNGVYSETAAPGSAAPTTVKLTDTIAHGRLNGRDTAAVVLVTDPGGSGTFHNLAVVRVEKGKPVNVAIARLGDRVKVIGVSIGMRGIEVDLVTQGPTDPMCCPTLHARQMFILKGRRLVRASADSPSAQPATPGGATESSEIWRTSRVNSGENIVGPTWKWEQFQESDGKTLVVNESDKYTLQFMPDGRFEIRADCNRGSGSYRLDGGSLSLTVQLMTMAACPPESLSDRYLRDLHDVVTYALRDGTLFLTVKVDGGNLVFGKTK